jgi:hypothetical protein
MSKKEVYTKQKQIELNLKKVLEEVKKKTDGKRVAGNIQVSK